MADFGIVHETPQRQMQPRAIPGFAQSGGGDGDRRKRTGGLALKEAESLGDLAGHQGAQADVVAQHYELDMRACPVRRYAHGHVVQDDGDLRFEVDVPGFVRQGDVVAGAEESVG